MANQIAAYYAAYPKSEAVEGIQKHVHSFWEPRMRNALQAFLADGGDGLDPLFIEAMTEYFKGAKKPATPAPPAKAKKKPANAGATPSVNRGR